MVTGVRAELLKAKVGIKGKSSTSSSKTMGTVLGGVQPNVNYTGLKKLGKMTPCNRLESCWGGNGKYRCPTFLSDIGKMMFHGGNRT